MWVGDASALLALGWPKVIATVVGVAALIAVELHGGFLASYTKRYGTALGCFVIGWMLRQFSVSVWGQLWIRGVGIDRPFGWALAATTFLFMMFAPISGYQHAFVEYSYIAAFAAIVILLARVRLPSRLRPFAQLVGELSFGIYLWHWLIFRAYRPHPYPHFLIDLVILIALSLLSYRCFERPMMEAIRSINFGSINHRQNGPTRVGKNGPGNSPARGLIEFDGKPTRLRPKF